MSEIAADKKVLDIRACLKEMGIDVTEVWHMDTANQWMFRIDPGSDFPAYVHAGVSDDKLGEKTAQQHAETIREDMPGIEKMVLEYMAKGKKT